MDFRVKWSRGQVRRRKQIEWGKEERCLLQQRKVLDMEEGALITCP